MGKCIEANGSTYEGGFHHGLKHGHGVYTDDSGNSFESEWVLGEQSALMTLIQNDHVQEEIMK